MRGIKESLLVLVALTLLSTGVLASIGVSPPDYSINFKPNLRETFTFEFFGDGGTEYHLYVKGDLAKYAKLSKKSFIEAEKIEVTLDLPREVEIPGNHILYVGASEQPQDPNGFALVGNIKGMITVRVPYPEKYVMVSFRASDAKSGEPVYFNVEINNLGVEDITASTKIEVIDSSKKIVSTIPFQSELIGSTKSKALTAQLNTTGSQAGSYKARVVVEYGGKNPAEAEALFRLGELYINVTSHSNDFIRNRINKLDLNLESFWNDPIKEVYAEISIPEYGIKFKTPSASLERFSKGILTGFFDTTGIPENIDEFKGTAVLYYEGKTTQTPLILQFKKEVNYLLYGLIIALAVAVLIAVIVIIKVRKLEKIVKSKK